MGSATILFPVTLFAVGAGCGQVSSAFGGSDPAGEGGTAPATGGALGTGGNRPTTAAGGEVTAAAGVAASGGTTAGAAQGGAPTAGRAAGGDGHAEGGGFLEGGTTGEGGAPTLTGKPGPCDLYADAGTPCVAAYSTVRRLRRDYVGPLYQVRTGSNAMNTGSGGQLHDIGATPAGFADAKAQDALCAGTLCTVARLYDQSGKGNDLLVAPAGIAAGGEFADTADFESIANAGPLSVDGNAVYSLFMEQRQGYRSPTTGNDVPARFTEQGIYMLADGTRVGDGCCWDFGNAPASPSSFTDPTALFLGTAFWGSGSGDGPWFMVDAGNGVWAGGSVFNDPGWGAIGDAGPPNPANPSLAVPFALGFLKSGPDKYALRMADAETAETLTTAYEGRYFKGMNGLGGAIILGIGKMNENRSFGTFYEGAVVAGYPTDEVEQAVLRNVQAAGYGKP